MNDLVVVEKIAQWQRLKALVLDSVSSAITRRVYNMALDEFMTWFRKEPRPGFSKLAAEAADDNGLIARDMADGIRRVNSVKSTGIRVGNWLSLKQAQVLLSAPDIATVKGLRDRAILAVLLGCGLRRPEVAKLTFAHVQQRDGRCCIVDLVGRHGRVRTVPVPT
jgi:integrase